MQPIKLEIFLDDKTLAGMKSAEGNIAALESFNRQMVERLQGELKQLERQYKQLQKQGLAGDRELADIQALKGVIGSLKDEIKAYEAAKRQANETPLVAHDPAPKLNQVKMTMAQIARELPSLAMGPQMFFLAISNNLPIFTDELARARKEYDELQKSGKKGTPVWKQVLSSLFSWQTAMTTGIMLLVMYGDEIWDWTKNLFSAKKGVDEFNISLKEMTEIEKDGRAQMVRTRFELKSVIDEIKNFTGSKEQEKAKVEELNRKYGESFGYYKTLSEWYDTLIQKSEDYVQVLLHQANVQNLVKKAAEADEEVNKIKAQKPEEAESAMGFFGKWGQYIMQSSMAESGQFYDAQAAIKKHDQEAYDILLKNAENKRDGYLKKAEEEVKKAAEAAKKGNIGGHIDPKQPGKKR